MTVTKKDFKKPGMERFDAFVRGDEVYLHTYECSCGYTLQMITGNYKVKVPFMYRIHCNNRNAQHVKTIAMPVISDPTAAEIEAKRQIVKQQLIDEVILAVTERILLAAPKKICEVLRSEIDAFDKDTIIAASNATDERLREQRDKTDVAFNPPVDG